MDIYCTRGIWMLNFINYRFLLFLTWLQTRTIIHYALDTADLYLMPHGKLQM